MRLAARFGALAAGVFFAGASIGFGQFTPISAPDAAYTRGTNALTISGADYATVPSLTNGVQTITFSISPEIRTVPDGWGSWASPPATEGTSPRVLYAHASPVTLTLSLPTTTFGFELEPNNTGPFSVTADFRSGATSVGSITQSLSGASGARLFAATSATPVDNVVITADSGAGGFALARIRYAGAAPVATPLPNSLVLTTIGIMTLIGFMMARRRTA